MARAALEWSLDQAATATGVSRRTVLRLEQGERLQARNAAAVRQGYEAAGVRFAEPAGVFAPASDA
jgi:transcriptional regulator with XRE-family HTH domain